MVSTVEIYFLMVLKTRSPGFRSGRISSWWGLSCWLVDSCLLTVVERVLISSYNPIISASSKTWLPPKGPASQYPHVWGLELQHRSVRAGNTIQLVAVFCLVFGLVWFFWLPCSMQDLSSLTRELVRLAVEMQSHNSWTTTEVCNSLLFLSF